MAVPFSVDHVGVAVLITTQLRRDLIEAPRQAALLLSFTALLVARFSLIRLQILSYKLSGTKYKIDVDKFG